MSHRWKPSDSDPMTIVCYYRDGGCGMMYALKGACAQEIHDSPCCRDQASTPPSPAPTDTVVRPGDIILCGKEERTVITWQECEALVREEVARKSTRIPSRCSSSRGHFGEFNLYTTLDGKQVTGYSNSHRTQTATPNESAQPRADKVAPHIDPNQDDDGMITGWDGRKVWL